MTPSLALRIKFAGRLLASMSTLALVLAAGACDSERALTTDETTHPTALRGKINAAMADRVREAIARGQRHFTIESRGGYLFPAINIGKALRDAGATLVVDGTCMSACVLVLQTVPDRRALAGSDIRLHRAAPEYGADDAAFPPVYTANAAPIRVTGNDVARAWLVQHAVPADIVDRDTAGLNTRSLRPAEWTRLGIRTEPWR